MNDTINEVVVSFNQYVQNIPNGSQYIIEQLRTDNVKDALDNIKNFSEGMIWLLDATTLLKKNNVEVEFDISPIIEFLEEINEALVNEDYYLVADLFEYEIAPFFSKFELISEFNS